MGWVGFQGSRVWLTEVLGAGAGSKMDLWGLPHYWLLGGWTPPCRVYPAPPGAAPAVVPGSAHAHGTGCWQIGHFHRPPL